MADQHFCEICSRPVSLLHIQQAHREPKPPVNLMAAELLEHTAFDLREAKAKLSVDIIRNLVVERLAALDRHVAESERPPVCANCYVWFNRSSAETERMPCRNAMGPCKEPTQ